MSRRGLTTSLHTLTASDIVRTISAGNATCEDVARACLERIEAREPDVQAWHYLDPDQVIRRARGLDQRGASGPLHGVPFAIKDIIDTYDMPTAYGSPIYQGHRPRPAGHSTVGGAADGVMGRLMGLQPWSALDHRVGHGEVTDGEVTPGDRALQHGLLMSRGTLRNL